MRQQAGKARENLRAFAGTATAAGIGLYGFINATREFNESKFGYGFARITDYIKDGKLDTAAWKADMDRTAMTARNMAKQVGSTADVAMKAREEVEKLGFSGDEAKSIWTAALGLHLTESDALSSGDAAKFMGTIYRAYEKQRAALAKKIGADANDPGFIDAWIKGMAGKAAVAGAESALGPADLVEGMRQFAPQWAQLGMSPEFAMAALAHGSNYGFRAPELGTAFKSMASRVIKPTPEGQRFMNALHIDRTKFMNTDAADPTRAYGTLNSLLGGSVAKYKKYILRDLIDAQKKGVTGSAGFQEFLSNKIAKLTGRRTEQDLQEIQMAVANSTLSSGGQVDLAGLIKELVDKKAGPAALMSIFEGKHYARGTPMFEFYDKMYALFEKLNKVDGSIVDSVIEGRKDTEAGTADQLAGAWKELLLSMQDTGVIETVKNAMIGLADVLRSIPTGAVKALTWGLLGLAGLKGLATLGGGAVAMGGAGYAGATWLARMLGLGGAGAAGATALKFGMGPWKPNSAAAKIANQRLLFRLSRAGLASDAMVAGMSAAGAGATAGGAVGKGLLRRAGAMIIPGLGWVMLGTSAATGAYAAYKDYQKTGSAWSAAKAFGWGFLTMGMGGEANAAEGGAEQQPDQQAQDVSTVARQAAEQIRATFSGLNLTAEGQRIIESLAAGMRAGIPAVQAAASSAAAAAAGNALRGAYSDGAR